MNMFSSNKQKKSLLIYFVLLSVFINNSYSTQPEADEPAAQNGKDQMIEKTLYGKLADGREVFLFSLKNESGTQVNIINYGARVTNLFVKDKNGIPADIVLGYDSLKNYLNDNSFLGAVVGRFGNRIAKGKFSLDGKEYILKINNGENHLHGGLIGFDKVLWDAEPFDTSSASLKLSYTSIDGEEGYPGRLTLTVTYSLTEENELVISYEGKTDKTTILNPTHHSYFNLTGDPGSYTILDHELVIDAEKYTPADEGRIPTGELTSVGGTPLDFRTPKKIGEDIDDEFDQVKTAIGYDHNFALNNYDSTIRKVASAYDKQSGRFMEVLTDQPGLQFYSGNFLKGEGKKGIIYKSRTGFCLEAQHFPDSPNRPEFPPVVLKPGEIYRQTTVYKFSIK